MGLSVCVALARPSEAAAWIGTGVLAATACLLYWYAAETREMAEATRKMAEAAAKQAKVAESAFFHQQLPCLVLAIYEPKEGALPMQVQNVGGVAAVWPEVSRVREEGWRNLLDDDRDTPHILPPRQFSTSAGHQFALPTPAGNECALAVRCEDPRTGAMICCTWMICTVDRKRWVADPHPDDAICATCPGRDRCGDNPIRP
jgi:hypothetical protein